MAGYSVRSLAELSKTARGYFTGAIEGAVASVWANTFTVIGKVLALLDFEHDQRRAWLFKQMFASTADELWLARHAFELGLSASPGTAAIGQITVAAPIGLSVPAGLGFVRGDGVTYTTLTGATATVDGVTVYVEADAVGGLGNADAGTVLALSSDSATPVGLATQGAVAPAADGSGLTGGTDAEAVEALRARVLARRRNPPQGGAADDYRAWVHEALGTVRDVFVDSFQNDSRSVWVMFTVTDQPNFVPTSTQVALVQAYLDDPLRRPVTARVFVSAPVPQAVPILIQALEPDTPDIRASIAAELAAVFIDRAEPGKPSQPFRLYRSWLEEAIGRAVGEDGHDLPMPAADIVFAAGQYPVLGAISYTD
ncbi:baseplate J/gp47 family protein [Methylobacterium sp. E-041]|uniref:baseplate J/gp47 family protein n=1 Tax=Methylobacterium sp. E-041 TaxID=2836573 RepID=UPI001FB9D58E|nr:baseplate J/gp47 family protein [Methylobacterium sp. E-041]MCJ2108021.1 baseplate J/gp47 family protein [Methylobacterium sp. E-041]